MIEEGWIQFEQCTEFPWLGTYEKEKRRLIVSSNSRGGDVIAQIGDRRVRAECKKGNLGRTKGNPENRLIHEAIGQLMTIEDYSKGDILLVAVPDGLSQRAKRNWLSRPLMKATGISLVLVSRDGTVDGLPDFSS
jgi:hypothetical protein